MDLLEFARGPALQVAAYIFVAGTIWRIVGIMMLKEKPDYSEPRRRGGLPAAAKMIWTRAFTADAFKQATMYPKMMGYFMHIGLFVVIFFFVPHIMFTAVEPWRQIRQRRDLRNGNYELRRCSCSRTADRIWVSPVLYWCFVPGSAISGRFRIVQTQSVLFVAKELYDW